MIYSVSFSSLFVLPCLQGLYIYPQAEFPYFEIVRENAFRDRLQPEFELEDTSAFDNGFWNVIVEYAKASPEDIYLR
jgi:hypothetical protein